MQFRIWDLICKNSINQIVYVSTINNIFFKNAFENNLKHNFPIDQVLNTAKKKVSKHLMHPEVFSSNFHLLAACHLVNQKNRLTSSNYLGDRLMRKKISVKAFVYQPNVDFFYSPKELEEKGYLINRASYN